MVHQFLYCNLRIVNVCTDSITALGEIVRSHVCSHTYGNT